MIKLLEKIYKMSQPQLKQYLSNTLSKGGRNVINADGYLYRKGTVPVLLVAHMDTVHKMPVKRIVYSEKGNVLSSPQGLGGDDRNGVYMCLKVLDEFDCHILFVEDEEIGCVGSNKFIETFKGDVDVNYIIEFDRRDANDAVYYDLDNPKFENFITDSSDGYFKTALGSVSDISYLAPWLGVAAVNLSCGYYKEHKDDTYTVVSEMMMSIDMAKQIIATPVEKPFKYIEKKCHFGKYDTYYGNYGFEDYVYEDKFGNYDFEEYAVYFEDECFRECVNYVEAVSEAEAVGLTLQAFPSMPYNRITGIVYSKWDNGTGSMVYMDGELIEMEIDD